MPKETKVVMIVGFVIWLIGLCFGDHNEIAVSIQSLTWVYFFKDLLYQKE